MEKDRPQGCECEIDTWEAPIDEICDNYKRDISKELMHNRSWCVFCHHDKNCHLKNRKEQN